MRIREILTTLYDIHKREQGISMPFICGGIPRDKVIGSVKSKFEDLDLTTGDSSVIYLAQFFAQDLSGQYAITKKSHEDGHISITLGDFKVDFSSNFKVPDIEKILFGLGVTAPTEMQKEMYSRDFTCNSLLLSIDLKDIKDPTGKGLADIKQKIIKTCLSPDMTLKFNVNRIPRIIYVAAKLGFDVDPKIIEWVAANPAYLQTVKPNYIEEKVGKANQFDPERTKYLIDKMNIRRFIPQAQEPGTVELP